MSWILWEHKTYGNKNKMTPTKHYLCRCLQLHQFFTFFSSPIYVFFAEKVNHRCLQLNLFCCCICVHPHSTMPGIHTYLSSDMAPRLEDPPSPFAPSPHLPPRPPSCLSPPTPRPLEAAVCLAIAVDGAVNYILPVLQRALLLPNVKRTAQMCCLLERIKLNHQLHPIVKFTTNIAAMRSRKVTTRLPRCLRQWKVKILSSKN